jgi:uncharacterized damage-inducible protein DinB
MQTACVSRGAAQTLVFLAKDNRMQNEVDRIVDELSREFDGDPWHGSPLSAILDGISAAQAVARPLPGGHSIWELVLHVTAWKNEVRRRVLGGPAREPEEGDWPPVGAPTDARWRDAVADLGRAHERLLEVVRDLPEARLFEPTNDPRNRPLGAGVTHYVLLHGAVQHDVYHAGQIAILKKGFDDQ